MVDGFVELALGCIDADFLEQRVHAEGAGLVGDDRHDAVAECSCLAARCAASG